MESAKKRLVPVFYHFCNVLITPVSDFVSDQDKMISRSDAKMSELASEQTRLKKAQQSLMVCV